MTYRIRLAFDAAHYLPGYDGPCGHLHGHTWKVEFYLTCPDQLDTSGIGIDFKILKQKLKAILPDHKFLNEQFMDVPSAENLIKRLAARAQYVFGTCVEKVVLWETEENGIEYVPSYN